MGGLIGRPLSARLPAALLALGLLARADASPAQQVILLRPPAQGADSLAALPPGSGVVQVEAGGRVITRAVDPRAPLRLIVELAAEPRATGALHGSDPAAAFRALDLLRSQVTRLGGVPAGPGGTPRAIVTREFHEVFCGAAVTIAPELAGRLRSLPGVRRVVSDDTVRATLETTVPLIGADRVRTQLGGTGAGIRVGIVDTGIDYDHPAFGGGFGPGHRVAGGWDFVNDDGDPRDDNGHGTHVAGIVGGNGGQVLGVAPAATLYAFKVLNAGGAGITSQILAGLDRVLDPDENPATNDAMQVINLSLGGPGNPDDPLSLAIDRLTEAGVVCAVAAGNNGGFFTIGSPGTSRRAITTGSSTKTDALSSFSSRGPAPGLDLKPDLVAPGDGVVSAALGGGRVALSGTSMATPHVAGVAAQLRQLHPEWTPDQIKSVVTGTAKDLGLTVFEQGAGRLDAWAAAHATFALDPGHLSFGLADGAAPAWITQRTVTLRNLTALAETVSFVPPPGPAGDSVTVQVSPGVTLTVAPASVILAASSSAIVRVTLRLINSSVPYPPAAPYGFGGALLASAAGQSQRLPWSFHKGSTLRVDSDLPIPWGVVHDRRLHGWSAAFSENVPVLLPPGRYDLVAGFLPVGTFVVREGVDVTGETVLHVGPDDANLEVVFDNVDAQGRPVSCRSTFSIFHDVSKMGFNFVGFPVDRVHVTAASNAYRLEWMRVATNGRDQRLSFAGAIQGWNGSSIQRNRPQDLHHVVIHMPQVVPVAAPLVFDLFPFRTTDGYIGFAFFDTTAAPLTAPTAFDWWLQTSPYAGHLQLGTRIDVYPWDHGPLPDLSSPAMLLPHLRLDLGWPIEGHVGSLVEPRSFTFGGEHMRLDEGAPIWGGQFSNSASTIGLGSGSSYSARHLISDMYGATRREADLPYTLQLQGQPLQSDTLPGSGGLEASRSYTLPALLGPCTFRSERPYTLAGMVATLRVESQMTLGAADPNPPSLRGLQVLADGEATGEIWFSTAQEVGVRFRMADSDPGSDATLRIRPPGADWIALPAQRNGDEWLATLPAALEGPVGLQLVARDGAGNQLTETWDPAFVAHSASVTFSAIGAEADDGRVRLSWNVTGAAGLQLRVERREGSSGWSPLGWTSPRPDGVVSYEDSTARGGRTYGYHLVLQAGGTPLTSPELVITVPVLRLALAGARPNPAVRDAAIWLTLPDAAPARLDVLDVTGRLIERREVGRLGVGTHAVNLAGPWKAGLYFVRLSRGDETLVSRMVVLE